MVSVTILLFTTEKNEPKRKLRHLRDSAKSNLGDLQNVWVPDSSYYPNSANRNDENRAFQRVWYEGSRWGDITVSYSKGKLGIYVLRGVFPYLEINSTWLTENCKWNVTTVLDVLRSGFWVPGCCALQGLLTLCLMAHPRFASAKTSVMLCTPWILSKAICLPLFTYMITSPDGNLVSG